MKAYFLKLSGALLLLGVLAKGAVAQQVEEERVTNKKEEKSDLIIVHPKDGKDTKVTIEIKDGEVKVNGKPLSEFSDDNVSVTKRKAIEGLTIAPNSRFRSGAWSYSGDGNIFPGEDRAFLGVTTDRAAEGGAKINEVSNNSAAEKAGLKKGDVIVRVNDQKITSAEDLTKAIGKYKPEEKVTIVYKREGKEMNQSVALGKRKVNTMTYSVSPDAFNFDRMQGMRGGIYGMNGRHGKLGIKAQEMEEGKGVKVLDVDDESPADKAGIKEGDIITEFDGTEVNNVEKLSEVARTASAKPSFKIKLTRDGKSQEIQVKIPKNLKTTNL